MEIEKVKIKENNKEGIEKYFFYGSLTLFSLGVIYYILNYNKLNKKIKGMAYRIYDYLKTNYFESLDERQKRYINQLHPYFRNKIVNLMKDIESLGYEWYPTSAYRSFEKQMELYNSGATTTKISMHNFGLAIDVVFKKNGKQYGFKTSKKDWLDTGIPDLIKNKYKLTWGGDFPNFYDPVHIGLDGKIKTSELKKRYDNKQFIVDNINKDINYLKIDDLIQLA